MWKQIFEKAVQNIQKSYGTNRAFGKEVGGFVGGQVVGGMVVYGSVKFGNKTVSIKPVKELYMDESGYINDQKNGHLVAVIYEGNDGIVYKNMGDKWVHWNGHDWA